MAIMGKKVWAVMCGKIRWEFDFNSILAWLCEQRFKGLIEGIVFSTWVGEIDQYQGLRNKLNELGIYVAELPEMSGSDSMAGGNNGYFLQAMQIEAGLKMVPNDVFVIKCRTDFCMHVLGKILYLLENNVDLSKRRYGCYNSALKYRIAINVYSIGAPFCFDDICYLAYKQDIEKLIIFENTLYKYNENSNPNYLFFANAFKNQFPIINDFFSLFKYGKLSNIFFNEFNRFKSNDIKLPGTLNKFFALYFVILYSDFYLLDNRNISHANSIDAMDIFRCSTEIGIQRTWITKANDSHIIDQIINGDIAATAGSVKLYNEIIKIASPSYAEQQAFNIDDYNETVEFGKKYLDMNAGDWLKPFSMIDKINRSAKDFSETLKTLYSEKASDELVNIIKNITSEIPTWSYAYYSRVIENLEKFRKLDSEIYESALIAACRSMDSNLLKKVALMLYGNSIQKKNIPAAEYYFMRYNEYKFPIVADKLAAYYYFGKYSEPAGNNAVPKKFYETLLRQFKLPNRPAPQSYADGVLVLIKEIVNERYAEYKQNTSIKYMIDFLVDEFPDDSFSNSAKSYLWEYLINRRYTLPFKQRNPDAFDKLLASAQNSDSETEAEFILKLILREKSNQSIEKQNLADEAINVLIEKYPSVRSCITAANFIGENEIAIITPSEIKNNNDFILLLRTLSERKCLRTNRVKILNLCGCNRFRLVAFELFLRIEYEPRIRFFSMKNGAEMWINYTDFLNSEVNNEFLLIKNNDGMAWPYSDKGSDSAYAAYLKLSGDSVFISIELSSGKCAAKDMLFEELDRSTLNSFDDKANIIRLKVASYPFVSSEEIGGVVNNALDEFLRIGALIMETVSKIT